ncbi:MAG TPA: DUF4395 domain-containing protein [Acidimicrobiales bacterium]|nr:DUF4395 domain-containing protein [Acidimicrobiales bacterium]
MTLRSLFSFPDPVNEKAARTVAAGVVVMSVAGIAAQQPWLLVVLAAGFWARVLTGPTLSPLGRLATSVVAPALGKPKPVPGPPKRFAQAIGTAFSTAAVLLWFGAGAHIPALAVTGALASAAFLEAVLGLCLGCKMFGVLMRVGLVPRSVCEACADISLRHPELLREPART